MSSSSSSKKMPTASKPVKKGDSKMKKEDSEAKARDKLVSKSMEYAQEITETAERIAEDAKKLALLIRKSSALVGIEKKKKPQSEKAYMNQQWKVYCGEHFKDQIQEEMMDIKEKEGKDDDRGLKVKATTSIANKYKETMSELYETTCNLIRRRYHEEYLPTFAVEKGDQSDGGVESEEDDVVSKEMMKAMKSVAPAKAGAGGSEDYESDKGSGDEKPTAKKTVAKKTSSSKKKGVEVHVEDE